MPIALAAAFLASRFDLRERRIPDALSLALACAGALLLLPCPPSRLALGFGLALGTALVLGAASALSGGGMGAGDLKFAASAALFLRPAEALLSLCVACALGLAHIFIKRSLYPFSYASDPSVPFAPALSGGLAAAFLLRSAGALPC